MISPMPAAYAQHLCRRYGHALAYAYALGLWARALRIRAIFHEEHWTTSTVVSQLK